MHSDRIDTRDNKEHDTMIMTVILDKNNRPILSITHNDMEVANLMAQRLNQANAELGFSYYAIVEVIH
jgi:hypothetical protein